MRHIDQIHAWAQFEFGVQPLVRAIQVVKELLSVILKCRVSYAWLAVEMHDVKIWAEHFFPEANPLARTSLHKGDA